MKKIISVIIEFLSQTLLGITILVMSTVIYVSIYMMNDDFFNNMIAKWGSDIGVRNAYLLFWSLISILITITSFLLSKCIFKLKKTYFYYNALCDMDVKSVKRILEAGGDPNYCKAGNQWGSSNPLTIITAGIYSTYGKVKSKEMSDATPPDIAIFNLLVKAGADVNRQPYIWGRIYVVSDLKTITNHKKIKKENMSVIERQKKIDIFIDDINRILEAFLKAGSDPDRRGHPYPLISGQNLTDEQANKYFEQGSRPINLAIEKGIAWESQVDILLQYTKLDEESLVAAERSKDPAMVGKIQKLWKKQEKL